MTRPALRSLLGCVAFLLLLGFPGTTQAGSGTGWTPDELMNWYGISQRRLNDTREDAGLPLLAADTYLWGLARERARDMLERDYLAATTPEGLDAGAYMRQDDARYDAWTEFRADDASGAPEDQVAWRVNDGILNDAGGRASVLGSFDRLGIGLAERSGRRVMVILIAQAAPDAAPPAAGRGAAVAALAHRYLGARYVYGGTSPSGFDCSGLVRYVVLQAIGLQLGRDVGAQARAGVSVDPANLRPGDLIFQQNTYRRGLSHVGIYIGDGQMISAENEGTGVRVASIWDRYWGPRFHSARRLA